MTSAKALDGDFVAIASETACVDGCHRKTEDLARRCCGRLDAHGNVHSLAEDIRISSLGASLPDDLEKHVQLNRARLTSYGVLREEIKTYL